MEAIILKTQSLAVGYDGKPLLREIELSVRPGEILTLIGPNGAGKSTVLKSLARQLAPLEGTVLLEGNDMSALREGEIARKMSLVMTGRVDAELMTCEDVVSAGRYPYTGRLGILSAADRQIVEETMALIGVADLRDKLFARISDGQRQRVLLARAICQEPRVLVMDEPTSYLDVRHKVEFLTVLRALVRQKHIAVVMSLHELDCARRISDRLLCIRGGAVDRVGSPDEVLTDDYIETLYGMEKGSYGAFFGAAGDQRFFQNRACKSFPCHKGVAEKDFNCLFCYCPLYALGPRCGGNFTYTARGVKSCVNCAFPHRRENYDALLSRFPEISALARQKEEDDHGV